MTVDKSTIEIIYNSKDITRNILPFIVRFTYNDKSQGEADELGILLEDSERVWQNEWYPLKGDEISASILTTQGVLNCGNFTIDEITGEGSQEGGDTITIKAIAAGINKTLRTKKSYAHENKTLREIANTVAANHGLTVEGDIKDVRITRRTQYRETDLSFLKKLSFEFGHTFSVRGKKLVFTNIFNLEGRKASLVLHRTDLTSWNITDKTSKTFRSAKIAYHNPKEKKIITYDQNENAEVYKGVKVDKLEIRGRAENEQQAELKSRVALYRANSLQQEGTFETPGNIYAVAGNNVELQGIGNFSGVYYLENSSHVIDKDGEYITQGAIKRVGLVNKSKQKAETKITD